MIHWKDCVSIFSLAAVYILFFKTRKKWAAKEGGVVPSSESLANDTWTTQDGRVLKITEMETSHLRSTIRWMERTAGRLPKHASFLDEARALDLINALQKEPRYLSMREELKKRNALSL